MKFRKLGIVLAVLCLLMSGMTVSAENISRVEDISLGQTKVITIPKPEGDIDQNWVYFTQEFTFVPEEDGTYRFLIDYTQDEANPYDIFMDVVAFRYAADGSKEYLDGSYLELENGCEFEGKANVCYELMFQYPTHDGRYPEFTFYLGTNEVENIPQTGDTDLFLFAGVTMLICGAALVVTKRKYFA